MAEQAASAPRLIAVRITGSSPTEAEPVSAARIERLVEITLPSGCSVRVDPRIDGRALRRIVTALRG
jgi:hypothetical protein